MADSGETKSGMGDPEGREACFPVIQQAVALLARAWAIAGRWQAWEILFAGLLTSGCNSVFDIHEGLAPPMCPASDPQLIDDMEDGSSEICSSAGRQGRWFVFSADMTRTVAPSSAGDLTPTLIDDGRRGASRYAARVWSNDVGSEGAQMGFDLNVTELARQPYDASSAGGIRFWMKSNVPVRIQLPLPETTLPSEGGGCSDDASARNCENHFSFSISAPSPEWTEYSVPFSALSQFVAGRDEISGNAAWNPRSLLGIEFVVAEALPFDVWVDDVRFYDCARSDCLPTCTDPLFPVSSPAAFGFVASCIDAAPTFLAVWGNRGSDAWVAGGWVMRHWNGSVWSEPAASPWPINGLWGSDWFDIWAVGELGIMLHLDGGEWSRIDSGIDVALYAVWGSGRDDVWAVGDLGVLLHFDGSAWSYVKSGTTQALYSVWGSAVNDVWAVGGASTLLHFDGSDWSATPDLPEGLTLYWVWGSGANDVWAIGPSATLHWDGSSWSEIETFGGPLWGSAADDIWQVGSPGTLGHWDGSSWSRSESGTTQVLYAISGSGAADVWAVGSGNTILHRSDAGWSTVSGGGAAAYQYALFGIWGSGPNDVWVVGADTFHWDGVTWSPVYDDATSTAITGVWGSDPNNVWVVGCCAGEAAQWDGSRWSPLRDEAIGNKNNGIWSSGPNDVWVVGSGMRLVLGSAISHWDGAAWSAFRAEGVVELFGIWGSDPANVWAVGVAGTILRWDGRSWSPVSSGTNLDLYGVGGTGSDDAWAVGTGGTIVHWDGTAWSPVPPATNANLESVWANAPNDVWAVGTRGTIVHWDGFAWSVVPSGWSRAIHDVWGSGAQDVWATSVGTLLHWDGSAWTTVSLDTAN